LTFSNEQDLLDFYPVDPDPGVKDLSVFLSHGERDPIFPIQVGEENAAFFRQLIVRCTYKSIRRDMASAKRTSGI
jgi:phospholipase/carboxylesterase